MTDAPMLYNFDGIQSVSGSIATFVSQMNQTLSDVDSVFRNLLAEGWSGAGADAFQGASQTWHRKADEMAQTLHMLAQKVGSAAVNMQQADQAAAARFS